MHETPAAPDDSIAPDAPRLARQVDRVRRMQWGMVAAAGTAAATTALAMAWHDPAPLRSTALAPRAPITLALPFSAPARITGSIPVPVPVPVPVSTPAGLSAGARFDRWDGLAASTETPGLLAVWNRDLVVLSRDGGGSFQVVLAGDGAVRGVAIAGDGTVWALRTQLGKRTPAGVETWRPARSFAKQTVKELAVAGGRLALVAYRSDGDSALYISSDDGATWDERAIHLGNAGEQIGFFPDGTIDVMSGEEAPCGGGYQWHERGNVRSAGWTAVDWPLDAPGSFGIGAHGWTYAIDESCGGDYSDESKLCAVTAGGTPQLADGTGSSGQRFADFMVASNGTDTFAAWGAQLYALEGTHARLLDADTPELSRLEVDGGGHPVALAGGVLLLFSGAPGAGWHPVFPAFRAG